MFKVVSSMSHLTWPYFHNVVTEKSRSQLYLATKTLENDYYMIVLKFTCFDIVPVT